MLKRQMPKALLKTRRQQLRSNIDEDDEYHGGDLDFHRGYSKPKLIKSNYLDDNDLPDHIVKKLAQIRKKVLEKYKEVYYNNVSQA